MSTTADQYDPPAWGADAWARMAKTHPEYLPGLRQTFEEIEDAKRCITQRIDASDVVLPDPNWYDHEINLRLDEGLLKIRMEYEICIPVEGVIPSDVINCNEWEHWELGRYEWLGPERDTYIRHVERLGDPFIEAKLQDLAEQAFREQIQEIRRRHLSMRAGHGNRPGPRPEDTCCKTPEWMVKLQLERFEADEK